MKEILQTAKDIARSSGEILKDYWQDRTRCNIEEKGINDLVSTADRESERHIREAIVARFPDHLILGEENGLTGSGEVQWMVDPLDGTSNFLHGYPWWAVSIGIRVRTEWMIGVVYNPLSGDLFWASRGEGAFRNNSPIHVSEPNIKDRGFIATGFPFKAHERIDDYLAIFKSIFMHARNIRRTGSAALDLAMVASGVFHGFFEFGLSPWDFAAGAVLIREAGGVFTDIYGGDTCFETGNILAGAPGIHRYMNSLIRPVK